MMPFESIRADIDAAAERAQTARYAFYLASLIHAQPLIVRALQQGNVYCVRYLIDTVVYHRVLGLTVQLAYNADWYQLRRPDLTVLLHIDEETRQRRLTGRGRTADDRLTDDTALRAALAREYQALSDEYIAIENPDGGHAGVIKTIRRAMRLVGCQQRGRCHGSHVLGASIVNATHARHT